SVDRLFDKGGSGNQTEQGGSAGSGGDANIQLVSEATDIVAENVSPLQPRRQRKGKTMVVDASEASHPPKKLREDHAIPTFPFVTSSVSTTPEREGRDHTDSMAEVDSLARSSIPLMTTITTITATVNPTLVVKEKIAKPYLFSTDSSSASGPDPNTGVFSNLSG
ncbi:hypothetical protein Tco_0244166, partial [Tanacetum coccineum]